MSEPVYEPTTERLYARLPEVLRRADAKHNWQLKTYLSGVVDQQSAVDELVARFQYLAPQDRVSPSNAPEHTTYYHPPGDPISGVTSDLVDAQRADAAWLPWLGQLFGVQTDGSLSEQVLRDTIATATGGFRAGSYQSLIDAVAAELTGSKYVRIYRNSNATDALGSQDEWHLLVVTKSTETPDFAQIVDSVIRKNAKPAGVMLFHRTTESPWDDVEAEFPTWDDWEATDWNGIEEVSFN